MKYLLRLLLFICLLGVNNLLNAQCSGGIANGSITPTATWQSLNTTNIDGNSYWTFPATAGFTYYFSFCTNAGGSSTYDTQITILDNLGVAVAGGYNDDFCGTQSYVAWTCIAAGTFRVLVTKYSCTTQVGLGTFVYKSGAGLTCPNDMGGGLVTVCIV